MVAAQDIPLGTVVTAAMVQSNTLAVTVREAGSLLDVSQAVGKTTLGEDMIMAIISSEQNMRNLPRLREIAQRLADPRGLS